MLLKGYRKFVLKTQIRCWVLQITILENNHKISCVSLNFLFCGVSFSREHKPLFIPIGLYFMKRHIWRVSYFFIKQLTKIETSSTFFNSNKKILENSRKFRFSNFLRIFTYKISEFEFSLYETIFSKLKHHYYNLFIYIPLYTIDWTCLGIL